MSHYTIIYKNGERMRDFLGLFVFIVVYFSIHDFGGVFDKTVIPLALVGYEMIIANSALRASLAIYHLLKSIKSFRSRLIGLNRSRDRISPN